MSIKKNKYLGINLTKEVQNVYSENYKTLFKQIEENLNKLKDSVFTDQKT